MFLEQYLFLYKLYLIKFLTKAMHQEWKGATSKRFSGGRKHDHPSDALSLFMKEALPTSKVQGLKTFNHSATQQKQFIPCLKIFPEQGSQTTQQQSKGKKIPLIPQQAQQAQRIRKEKRHVQGGKQTCDEIQWKGIRSYNEANKSKNNEYCLQNAMQKKKQVEGLDYMRNNIQVASLGDKSYKYPQYSPNFYHNGGLIVGSTNSYNGKKSPLQAKITGVLTKPNWDVKVKMDEIQEDKKLVNSVDEWQQTTLKQANPNWKDPDTFFEREQAAKASQGGGKGAKKGK